MAPLFMFAVVMVFEDKLIDVIAIAKITFVILAFMLVDDILVELKEGWEKGIGIFLRQVWSRPFGDKGRHVRKGYREIGRFIKLDEVVLGIIQNRRVKWNIHHRA